MRDDVRANVLAEDPADGGSATRDPQVGEAPSGVGSHDPIVDRAGVEADEVRRADRGEEVGGEVPLRESPRRTEDDRDEASVTGIVGRTSGGDGAAREEPEENEERREAAQPYSSPNTLGPRVRIPRSSAWSR